MAAEPKWQRRRCSSSRLYLFARYEGQGLVGEVCDCHSCERLSTRSLVLSRIWRLFRGERS